MQKQPDGVDRIYIPENDHGVVDGYYDTNELVELLRRHKCDPDVIHFLADMMEE